MALTLKVTNDRVEELPFSVYRKSGNDPDAQARFIAHFAINENGEYMTVDEAFVELDSLSMREVNDIIQDLKLATDEAAAPKA